ncbi:MAG: FkbM family methyltransferase [Azospirillaceae bacterium]
MTEAGGEAPVSKNTANLMAVIAHAGITTVLDVGANTGQYASRLRRAGYDGRIVSFEPLSEAHAALEAAAAGDPDWTAAPRLALGDADGEIAINVAAASDMSSALAPTAEMAALLDDARAVRRETVPLARLDTIFDTHVAPGERVLLKLDTQGFDGRVLDGAAGVMDRIALVQSELALVPIYEGEPDWRAMIDRMAREGFTPVLFIPGYFNRRTARLIAMDGVFARNPGDAAPRR